VSRSILRAPRGENPRGNSPRRNEPKGARFVALIPLPCACRLHDREFMIVNWNGRRLFDDQDGQASLRQRLTGEWRKCGSSIPILLDASDSGSLNSPLKITSASAAIRWSERLAHCGRKLSSKLAEGALYASHHGLPVPSRCLPEESHCRIPGTVFAIEHPTPVRRERQ